MQIEAGQYCTFSVLSDGSVRACGKGSYGRLGLGDSNNQSVPKKLVLDPPRCMRKVSSSKGSDGHTLAVTVEGEVFSWGDGDYGKLGHGNSATQKYPKIIQGPLLGKVRRSRPCDMRTQLPYNSILRGRINTCVALPHLQEKGFSKISF